MDHTDRADPGNWLLRATPRTVMALALSVAILFVLARWAVAADGDLTRFVVAGSDYTSPQAGVSVSPGAGYDGQFSYRLALDPTMLERRANGVTIDGPLRLQRITYPVLSYLAAFGVAAWVPYSLVVVNVVALALLALFAATLARDAGRAPIAGLVVAGYFGFATSLGRDLTEIVTAALFVGGVLALRRQRLGWAAVIFSAAVLSRETAMLLYAALALPHLAALGRGAVRDHPRVLAWTALPAIVFVTWQGICYLEVGAVPLLASSGKNLVVPLQDLLPAAAGWLRGAVDLERSDLINVGQLCTLVVVVAAAARSLRTSQVPAGVKAAWLTALLLVTALSGNVWMGPADFRTSSELSVLSGLVLLGSDRPLRVPAVFLLATGGLTALFRITSI